MAKKNYYPLGKCPDCGHDVVIPILYELGDCSCEQKKCFNLYTVPEWKFADYCPYCGAKLEHNFEKKETRKTYE